MASFDDITIALRTLTLTNVAQLDQELGRGSYGKVFTVKYRQKIYAAKEIHSILLETANPEEKRKIKNTFLRECYHCSLLSHPNIVRFIGIYYPASNHSTFPVMVMELMADSLTKYVRKSNISMKMKASILYDVAFGLNHLHTYNPPIIHRDLSPNNILLSRDSVAKISDLGVAKLVQADSKATQTMLTKVPGTADFMPPESFAEIPNYETSLDIFSYGGIVLHVVNQEWPSPAPQIHIHPKTGRGTVLSEVERRQTHLNKMKDEAEVLKPLVKACLHNLPSKRPIAMAIFKLLEPLKVNILVVASNNINII